MEREQVRRGRWGCPEEDVRGVEVIESPQERREQQHDVDWPEHGKRDHEKLAPLGCAIEAGRLVHIGRDGLQASQQEEKCEWPAAPDGCHHHAPERIPANQPEGRIAGDTEITQESVDRPIVPLEHKAPGNDLNVGRQREWYKEQGSEPVTSAKIAVQQKSSGHTQDP